MTLDRIFDDVLDALYDGVTPLEIKLTVQDALIAYRNLEEE